MTALNLAEKRKYQDIVELLRGHKNIDLSIKENFQSSFS